LCGVTIAGSYLLDTYPIRFLKIGVFVLLLFKIVKRFFIRAAASVTLLAFFLLQWQGIGFSEQSLVHSAHQVEEKFERDKYLAYKAFAAATEEPTAVQPVKPLSGKEKVKIYEKALVLIAGRAEKERKNILKLWKKIFPSNQIFFASFLAVTPQIQTQILLYQSLMREIGEPEFIPDPSQTQRLVSFLRNNSTKKGMPLSYQTSEDYWTRLGSQQMDEVDSVLERVLTKYGLNIYDGALWQIALSIAGDEKDVSSIDYYTKHLLSGSFGTLRDLRAYGPDFRYGKKKMVLRRENAFFFRIISDEYLQEDPLIRRGLIAGYPNFRTAHHEDWKPILGEQAWAAIIGPIQVAYAKYNGKIPLSSQDLKLALSILPAVSLMQSQIGAIYHAPDGTHGKSPDDISNENNFSMYAALKMLETVVGPQNSHLGRKIRRILNGQKRYFEKDIFDEEQGVFYQGGYYSEDVFIPAQIFAADCQTWGILALGPQWIDKRFGEGTAYTIWQNTKKRSGYFDERGFFRGIGFTDGHQILSIEWTCGAILAARKLVEEYEFSHPDWTKELKHDIIAMRRGIETYKVDLEDGSTAYLYANKRYFIPFSWWANPIPSLASSAWVILIDSGFNPFILGGGPDYNKPVIYEGAEAELQKTIPNVLEEKSQERIAQKSQTRGVQKETLPRPSIPFIPEPKTPARVQGIWPNFFVDWWFLFGVFVQGPPVFVGAVTGVSLFERFSHETLKTDVSEVRVLKPDLVLLPPLPPPVHVRLFQREVEEESR